MRASIMTTTRRLAGAIAAIAAAIALAACIAPAALADEPMSAHPLQSALSADVSGACLVDVLGVSDGAGKTVFVTLESGGQTVARMMPHVLAEGEEGMPAVLSLAFESREQAESLLAGGLALTVHADRAGKDAVWSGTVWPAYAELGDAGRKLVGTHAGAGGFAAPTTLAEGGVAYRLADSAEKSGDGPLAFAYEAYPAEGAADGSIRYLDVETGGLLSAYTPIPALVAGEAPREVAIPSLVEDGGVTYRTVSFEVALLAQNPGATSFTVPVAKLSDAAARAAGHYMAVVHMVDGSGEVIAADSAYVDGELSYALPDVIYRTGPDGAAHAYGLAAGEPAVLELSAARDEVTTGVRTIDVIYVRAGGDADYREVTFVLHDGTKRAGDAGRVIGTLEDYVGPSNPAATPPETWEDASGNRFELVGGLAAYAYTYGSSAAPVVDAYYLPEGYSGTLEPYEVTVSYVDYFTRQVIDTETFESSPSDLVDMAFEPPAQFARDGTTWVRLDGQEELAHSYWSQITGYTVYYRDRSRPAESVPVITRVRVVYRDGGVVYVAVPGATTAATTAPGTAAPATAGLGTGTEYTVATGPGAAATATAPDGRDTAQTQIDEAEVALASGTEGKDGGDAAGVPVLQIAGIGVLVALLILLAMFLALRRREREGK